MRAQYAFRRITSEMTPVRTGRVARIPITGNKFGLGRRVPAGAPIISPANIQWAGNHHCCPIPNAPRLTPGHPERSASQRSEGLRLPFARAPPCTCFSFCHSRRESAFKPGRPILTALSEPPRTGLRPWGGWAVRVGNHHCDVPTTPCHPALLSGVKDLRLPFARAPPCTVSSWDARRPVGTERK